MPATKDKGASLPRGRKRTDKSLSAERAKADKSLSIESKRTEHQTDDFVIANRAEADAATTQIRNDESLDQSRCGDDRLRQERRASDEAIAIERREMDAALEAERRQKRDAEEKLFALERQATDKDLTEERQQTDAEVQRVTQVLSDERHAHVATRAELTTRDEFLAIVSHDLRNPLGAIAMAVDLVTCSPSIAAADGETRTHLEMIGRNAGEALRLIGDLLDMEQIAKGKLGLDVQCHDAADLMRHCVNSYEPNAATKNLSIHATFESADVLCDRDRVSQVLSNLVGNAIKFTPAGGTITLSMGTKDAEVLISVADTGPGIPKDMQRKIFERFWQIGKHDRQGLGLGLYISKMIVEGHGGRIWVDSEARHGSSFRFTLPRAAPA